MNLINQKEILHRIQSRVNLNRFVKGIFLVATLLVLAVLALLLFRLISQGAGHLSLDFLGNYSSRFAAKAGIKAALVGSIFLMLVVAPVTLIIGVATAIYLEEYAPKTKLTNLIVINISNLAGVPSIIFGLLGLTVFVRGLMLGKSVIAAGLTMSLLVLPVIIVSSQEAIRGVPSDLREASYGMGAAKWKTILHVVLPAAIPGIATGCILALSRAVGETAPLVILGIPVIVYFLPTGLLSEFTALPMQIFDWAKRPQPEFQTVAAAGIVVLMVFLLLLNSLAVYIRYKYQKRY
ncbi:phosphate ABC transporter permease PstA [Rummeliibacillus stabekisii]|uniref:phosphate ABC transporter permease PstA n=1 Tax=Rummeliibacillus stabekisii TaxID=241244 RepID=UPI0020403B6E|nr:phosphate ABC transporter permease PstA [Rummeliibacillus stabekisii]MCM3316211.1 phosphate ABC transporter permease PstA [Rummeliibacillus stabekisii]